MDAVEFNKEFSRFCSNHVCSKCPIRTSQNFSCTIQSRGDNAESVVELVEGWAKDNPINTRQSEFLKMFPNADFCQGVIDISPCSIEKEMKKCCGDRECDECKRTYWLTEVTDNGND